MSAHKPACGRPLVTDGLDNMPSKDMYDVGEEVTLKCEQGYLPSRATPQRITCTATGTWTQSDLVCTREFTATLDFYTTTLIILLFVQTIEQKIKCA